MWASKRWVFGILVILSWLSSSVEAASVATATTGLPKDLLGMSDSHAAEVNQVNQTNHTTEHSSGDEDDGSGDSSGSGTTEEEEKNMSTGSIAAIVIASIAVIGIVGVSVMSCVLSSGMGSSSTGASDAALAGTGVSYGKKGPSLVISAEALLGKQ